MSTMSTREILGIPVVVATTGEAIGKVDAHLGGNSAALVTFLNANVSNVAARSSALRDILRSSLVLNDGIGVSIASFVLHGKFFPDNLNGTDFVPRFLKETRHLFRIYIVGSAVGIGERAIEALSAIAPQHDYVGAHHGFFEEHETEAVLADIRQSGADLVLVAMGSPKQELWAENHLIRSNGPSAICVGGLIDFVSQEKPRAPRWVRAIRSEWVFRLLVEPRRLWRRYLIGNGWFIARLGLAYFQSRRA